MNVESQGPPAGIKLFGIHKFGLGTEAIGEFAVCLAVFTELFGHEGVLVGHLNG